MNSIEDIDNIKQYICKICLELDKSNLISILNFLKKEHINNNIFNQNSDGIRINLDELDNEIILKLNNYVQFKLNEENKTLSHLKN